MKAIKTFHYQNPHGSSVDRVVYCEASLWMTQIQISQLFGCRVSRVYSVMKRLFESGELDSQTANRKIEIPNADGRYFGGNFYNLDAIIAVGYRLNPKAATRFHIWSSQILRRSLLQNIEMPQQSMIGTLRRRLSLMLAA